MGLGWSQVGGLLAKLTDHFIDPVKRFDRQISKHQREKEKILESKGSLSEHAPRLSELDAFIVQIRADRDRYLRRN